MRDHGVKAPLETSRSAWAFSATLLALAVAACSSSGGDASGATEGGGAGLPVLREERVATVTFDGAVHPSYPDITRVAALPGGDVVVVTLDYAESGRMLLARLDSSLDVVWTARFVAGNAPADVIVHDGAIVIATIQSPTSTRLVRFELDGVLRDVHDFEGITAASGLVGLDDGGMLLLTKGAVARLDPAMRAVWSKTIDARAAIVVDGDYVFAGNPLRLAPANASGIEVVRTRPDGTVVWQSFVTPGPGTHTTAGLGLVEGELVVACGNDSADSRSTAALSPLFVSRFDPATGDHRATSAAGLSLTAPDGQNSTLAFGSGLDATVHDGALHVGAILNAGGPQGARTSTIARIDGDSVLGRNLGGAFAVATNGDLVGANLFDQGPVVTRVDRLDGEGECFTYAIEGALAPIEVIAIRDAGGLDAAGVQGGVAVSGLNAERPEAVTTVGCGG
jgi:hypothetical protein